ncbi:mucin-2-like isoform X2 [Corticium candelabrum]|uniref:mucin-2-like isoform X2 n=1 Tax=Corticium candelabrum TaxID=121492 RepID=UPI002E260EB6|nr:mucin-2-like isoform X2 [Corticium candelabrum]
MRSSLRVCLLLGAVIKYALTEQEYICGVGPHNYTIDSPAFTIYQLVQRRVNLTIPLAGNKSESYRWYFSEGNSKLESKTFQVLRNNGTIETINSNATILLQNSNYSRIQIAGIQVVNNKTNLRGNYVTINIGNFPAVELLDATICDNSISVCVNITGTPPPITTILALEDVNMAAKNQTQFCSTFDKPSVLNILTVFITASNCFGSTTANVSISFINDISRCNFTTCSAVESSVLNPQQLASTASAISCSFTSVTRNQLVSSRPTIASTDYLRTSPSTSDKQTSTPTSIKQTSPSTSDKPTGFPMQANSTTSTKKTSSTRGNQQKSSQSTSYQQRVSLTTEYRKLATNSMARGTSSPPQKDSTSQGIPVYIIVAACVGGLVLIVVIVIIIVCCKRKSARKRELNSDLQTTEHIYANSNTTETKFGVDVNVDGTPSDSMTFLPSKQGPKAKDVLSTPPEEESAEQSKLSTLLSNVVETHPATPGEPLHPDDQAAAATDDDRKSANQGLPQNEETSIETTSTVNPGEHYAVPRCPNVSGPLETSNPQIPIPFYEIIPCRKADEVDDVNDVTLIESRVEFNQDAKNKKGTFKTAEDSGSFQVTTLYATVDMAKKTTKEEPSPKTSEVQYAELETSFSGSIQQLLAKTSVIYSEMNSEQPPPRNDGQEL